MGNGDDLGNAFPGNGVDHAPSLKKQETEEGSLRAVESEGWEVIATGKMNGGFEDGRLEFREEQVRMVRKNEEGRQVLAALAIFGISFRTNVS